MAYALIRGMKTPDLTNKIALVTGATRGIGAATAKALAGAGAHVILTGRTTGALEELDDTIRQTGGRATLIPLDLCDLDTVDTLGPNLYERFGKLDIFIANAGLLGTLGPLGHADAREWRKVMQVNLDANFHLIRTLEPVLKQSNRATAIFMTSGVTQDNRAYWGAYSVSKAALEALAGAWASECTKSPVRVCCFDPGRVETDMRARAYPGEDTSKLEQPDSVAEKICGLCHPDFEIHGKRLSANDI